THPLRSSHSPPPTSSLPSFPTRRSSDLAIDYFQQAIDKDPSYALAYAGLADSYLFLGSYWVESIPEAKAAALKAIELDRTLAEAHVALGHIKLWIDWDWTAAAAEVKLGFALNPYSSLAHDQY